MMCYNMKLKVKIKIKFAGVTVLDRNNYNTKQRDEIVEFFSRHRGSCFTAKDIIVSGEVSVGEATVYRTLTRLANQGVLKRFSGDGSGACYQLLDDTKCSDHFHLKCDRCQKLIHMDCSFMAEMRQHIESSHGFTVDIGRTIIYGLCRECRMELEAKEQENE